MNKLKDLDGGKKVSVTLVNNGIEVAVAIEGYGDNTGTADGKGVPIVLEFNCGELKLHVYSDINNQYPTHTISLEGAKETNRNTPEKENKM